MHVPGNTNLLKLSAFPGLFVRRFATTLARPHREPMLPELHSRGAGALAAPGAVLDLGWTTPGQQKKFVCAACIIAHESLADQPLQRLAAYH